MLCNNALFLYEASRVAPQDWTEEFITYQSTIDFFKGLRIRHYSGIVDHEGLSEGQYENYILKIDRIITGEIQRKVRDELKGLSRVGLGAFLFFR